VEEFIDGRLVKDEENTKEVEEEKQVEKEEKMLV
jgi:hypothetical protein